MRAFQIQIITHDALYCGAHPWVIDVLITQLKCHHTLHHQVVVGFFLLIPSAGILWCIVGHTGMAVILGVYISYYACYYQNTW